MLKGGWWWKSCGRGLNGLYLHDPQDLTARQGIVLIKDILQNSNQNFYTNTQFQVLFGSVGGVGITH